MTGLWEQVMDENHKLSPLQLGQKWSLYRPQLDTCTEHVTIPTALQAHIISSNLLSFWPVSHNVWNGDQLEQRPGTSRKLTCAILNHLERWTSQSIDSPSAQNPPAGKLVCRYRLDFHSPVVLQSFQCSGWYTISQRNNCLDAPPVFVNDI